MIDSIVVQHNSSTGYAKSPWTNSKMVYKQTLNIKNTKHKLNMIENYN